MVHKSYLYVLCFQLAAEHIFRHLIFSLECGKSIILDREQAMKEGSRILQDHAITWDRSSDINGPRCNAVDNGATASEEQVIVHDDQGEGKNGSKGRSDDNGASVNPPSMGGR